MKAQALLDLLQEVVDNDPDANIYLMTQPNYPFEHSIVGIVQRRDAETPEEVLCETCERVMYEAGNGKMICPVCNDITYLDDPDDKSYGANWHGTQMYASDVFILEGSQTQYGLRDAWDNART